MLRSGFQGAAKSCRTCSLNTLYRLLLKIELYALFRKGVAPDFHLEIRRVTSRVPGRVPVYIR
jgi:hypothetical protein